MFGCRLLLTLYNCCAGITACLNMAFTLATALWRTTWAKSNKAIYLDFAAIILANYAANLGVGTT